MKTKPYWIILPALLTQGILVSCGESEVPTDPQASVPSGSPSGASSASGASGAAIAPETLHVAVYGSARAYAEAIGLESLFDRQASESNAAMAVPREECLTQETVMDLDLEKQPEARRITLSSQCASGSSKAKQSATIEGAFLENCGGTLSFVRDPSFSVETDWSEVTRPETGRGMEGKISTLHELRAEITPMSGPVFDITCKYRRRQDVNARDSETESCDSVTEFDCTAGGIAITCEEFMAAKKPCLPAGG